MNIWMLNHYAGSLEYGMEFRHYYLARELMARGHQVTIVAGSYSHLRKYNPEIRAPKEEFHQGIRFLWVPTCRYTGNGLGRVKSMADYYFGAVAALRKLSTPDVILSSSPHPLACLAGIRVAKGKKTKNVSEVRDLWPEALIYYKGLSPKSPVVRILEFYEHRIYRRSDGLIFTKPGDVDHLREKGWLRSCGGDVADEMCFYLNNGVDLKAFQQQMTQCPYEALPDSAGKFVVTYVGTIRQVNHLDILLDAAARLKDREEIVFRIFGDGEELARLKDRKDRENLGRVEFYGRVEKQYIPSILAASTVNVLNYSPTLYNWSRGNSSNKLFEYMACGKPILSTVKMGYSPLVQYGCGVEIPDCDGEKLAAAIRRLQELPAEELAAMGQRGREAARDFDYPKLAGDLEKILAQVAGSGKKA